MSKSFCIVGRATWIAPEKKVVTKDTPAIDNVTARSLLDEKIDFSRGGGGGGRYDFDREEVGENVGGVHGMETSAVF